jgi:branched-subunit amino acid ABC-type transport system permease component
VLLEQLLNGVILGNTYALIALGYTMVYGILELINFAHGEIYMSGAFFGLMLVTVLKVPVWLAFPLAMTGAALLGMIVERLAYRPLRSSPPPIGFNQCYWHVYFSAEPSFSLGGAGHEALSPSLCRADVYPPW